MQIPLLTLLPNRVRRNYRGGYLLDRLENKSSPQDGYRPEDWLAYQGRLTGLFQFNFLELAPAGPNFSRVPDCLV